MNDGAVMKAWAENQGVGADGEGSFITFLADPHGTFTDAMGLRMEHPGPRSFLGMAAPSATRLITIMGFSSSSMSPRRPMTLRETMLPRTP